MKDTTFQQRVQPWMMECFGSEISADKMERNHRFFEESTELVQSCGMTVSEAHQLVDYVYGRPIGDPVQESGGVSVTHAALCLANGIDMHDAAEIELARIWTLVEKIRAKQAAKPKHSPLPSHPAAPQQAMSDPDELEAVIACLGDDAAKLRSENVNCEMAENMMVAAALLQKSGASELDAKDAEQNLRNLIDKSERYMNAVTGHQIACTTQFDQMKRTATELIESRQLLEIALCDATQPSTDAKEAG